jgi:hypothetical protein
MINLVRRIFGSPAVLKESISIIRDAGDALWYTEEEKAADRSNRAQQVDKLVIDWMESTKGQNLARRTLSFMLTTMWLIMFFAGTAGDMIAPFLALYQDAAFMDAWRESGLSIERRTEQLTGAMMLILAFYFAAPHMDKIVGGALSKFSGEKK